VSQSGETADTLSALRHLKGRVRYRIAVVNVPTSSIARSAEHMIEIAAGPEIAVASTKAFTGQLLSLAVLALKVGRDRGRATPPEEAARVSELIALPRLIDEVLRLEPRIERLAGFLSGAGDALFLGRGAFYPLALEAALKLKEISYIHAEGYAAG